MCYEHHYVLWIVQLYENSMCIISVSCISKTYVDDFSKVNKAADEMLPIFGTEGIFSSVIVLLTWMMALITVHCEVWNFTCLKLGIKGCIQNQY